MKKRPDERSTVTGLHYIQYFAGLINICFDLF